MNGIPHAATMDDVNHRLLEMQSFIEAQFQLIAERHAALERRLASLEGGGVQQSSATPTPKPPAPAPATPPPPPPPKSPKQPSSSFMYSTMPRRPFLKALVEAQALEKDKATLDANPSWAPRVRTFAAPAPRARPTLAGSGLVVASPEQHQPAPVDAPDAGQWVTATAVPSWASGDEAHEALIDAAKESRLEDVRSLLRTGADPNAEGAHGHKTLRWAVRNNNADCAVLILEAGGEVADPDYLGKTSLHRAAVLGHAAVARVLLEWGADVRARDHAGNTALHDAASYGHVECVTALLRAGASAYDKNDAGESPQGLAMRHEHEECVEVLRTGGRAA